MRCLTKAYSSSARSFLRCQEQLAEHQDSFGRLHSPFLTDLYINKLVPSVRPVDSIYPGHVSALKELLKEPSNRDLIKPMLPDFDYVKYVSDEEIEDNAKGKANRWRRPKRSGGSYWPVRRDREPRRMAYAGMEKFLNRFGMLKACDKDPTKISKIIRRANETLPHFKERWVSESNAIPNVPELMQISSFMSSHKCPELEKHFSDNLPRGELLRKDAPAQWVQRGDRPQRYPYGNNRRRQEHKSAFKAPERSIPYVPPQRLNQEVHRPRAVLTLDSLSSTPQEILATEHQLRLPQPTPLV
nr:reverse transcriptase domain-containing protein [Tanacetum cinerariifolium]